MLVLCGCASQVSWQCIIINEAPGSRRLAFLGHRSHLSTSFLLQHTAG